MEREETAYPQVAESDRVLAGIRLKSFFYPLGIPALLILLWAVASALKLFPIYILPPLPLTVKAFIDTIATKEIFFHIYHSMIRVSMGILIGGLIAIPLGLLLGWSKKASRLMEPLFHVLRQIPPLAWIPFALVW